MRIKHLSKFELSQGDKKINMIVCLMGGNIIYLGKAQNSNIVKQYTPDHNGILRPEITPCLWHDKINFISSCKTSASVHVTKGQDGWKLYTIKRGLFF